MTIGLISVISPHDLRDYLYEEDKRKASCLSSDYAPAVTTLALEWLKSGHRLVIFTLDPKAKDEWTLKGDNLEIHVAPSRAKTKIGRIFAPFGRDYFRLRKMLKSNNVKFDVVSSHWTRDFALVSKQFCKDCPVFVTVRDIMPYIIRQIHGIKNYPWYVNYIKNEIVMRCNSYNFIANSQYTAASIARYWNKNAPVISNPIDDRFFSAPNKTKHPSAEFSMASISISAIDDQRKNILTLLDAFQLIRKKHPYSSLSLIGQCFTTNNATVRQLNKEGKLEGVKLIGSLPHEDVINYLKNMDLMVHPSLEETFGNTLIEAMATGCPVLGGENSGAVPYVLDFGKAGYLCDVTSAQTIAEAIDKIIKDPLTRQEISSHAREWCKNEYSSNIIAEKYIDLFNNAISKRNVDI